MSGYATGSGTSSRYSYSRFKEQLGLPPVSIRNLSVSSDEQFSFDPEKSVHSCSHCNFVVQSPASGGAFTLPVSLTKKQVEKGVKAGCSFIAWCVSEAAEVGKRPPLQFDVQFIMKEGDKHDIVEAEFKFHRQFGPSLTVCAKRNDPAAQYISTRPINPDVSSEASFTLARQWIEDCHSTHTECLPNDDDFVPKMLIEVGLEGVKAPRLYIPKNGEKLLWCCLSYCWGGDQLIKTTRTTRDPFAKNIPRALMPQTVRDAIKTTRKLAVPYFWVDSLCITQDDPVEMADQISHMSEIYKRTHVTIVASSAGKSTDGFLQHRVLDELDIPMFALPYRSPDGRLGTLCFFSDNGYDPRTEPVRKRAWTMQERLLSSRILDYGTRHMRWASREYSHALKSTYIAGTFAELLPESLLWGVEMQKQRMKPSGYRAPSFSWASIDSPVKWYGFPFTSYHEYEAAAVLGTQNEKLVGVHSREATAVLGMDTKLIRPEDPYGAVSECYLKLKVRLVEDKWQGSPEFSGDANLIKFELSARADAIDEVYLELCQSVAIPVYILALLISSGSQLCLVALSDDGIRFRRVGFVWMSFGRFNDREWEGRDIILL
ncbi:HET-domain-containing protein [Tothia fuscella]|uniref:HET-domain-containing protein n=1 Tax=Tothia fuscella TaxID=1048955 RepID=A0A9P4NEQ5_9PEZI|nr:HET-domain-containing protein [Tothia fuscella]